MDLAPLTADNGDPAGELDCSGVVDLSRGRQGRVRELGQGVGHRVGQRVHGQRVRAKSLRARDFMPKRFTREPFKVSTRGPDKDVIGNKMFTTAFGSIEKAK